MQADRWANRLTDREMAGWIAPGGLVGGNAGRQADKTDRQTHANLCARANLSRSFSYLSCASVGLEELLTPLLPWVKELRRSRRLVLSVCGESFWHTPQHYILRTKHPSNRVSTFHLSNHLLALLLLLQLALLPLLLSNMKTIFLPWQNWTALSLALLRWSISLMLTKLRGIWLRAKSCACKGLCTSVENKTWMNEYIVQIISATRLWLISRYSHHTLKKRRKMTAKNGHPCTEWFSSLCLQTNRKHMEKQSLICTRKTWFYTDNITLTLIIVVFSINWSLMFSLYVLRICCKFELKTEQPKNDSIASESLETSRVFWSMHFRSMHLHYTAILFFFSEVLHEIWRIFPQSFDIVVISDVPTRYLIFCTKQTRKQSLFYRQHPARHLTFPECLLSPSRMACLCSETLKGVS